MSYPSGPFSLSLGTYYSYPHPRSQPGTTLGESRVTFIRGSLRLHPKTFFGDAPAQHPSARRHAYIRGNHAIDKHDLPLRPQDFTFVEMLQQKGNYRTFHTGKWGLGWINSTGDPMAKGFDYYYGQLDQANCHNMYPTVIFETEGGLEAMYSQDQGKVG